jgi:hypothetical protein
MATKKAKDTKQQAPAPKAESASFEQIAALKKDPVFRDRVGVAVTNYAAYVMGKDPTGEWYEMEIKWARQASVSTDDQVYRLMGFVTSDPAVKEQLGAIPDAQLQVVVENAIKNNMSVLL